jgi:hypothetical protein
MNAPAKETVKRSETPAKKTTLTQDKEPTPPKFDVVKEAEAKAERRWVDSIDIPSPLRPSHVDVLMDKYAADNGLSPEARDRMKAREFIREQGLPNPTRRFRVTAFKSGSKQPLADPASIEALDAADAIRVYKEVENKGNADLLKHSTRFETMIEAS